jgi:uncharacterized protein YcbK (DUF882 family)
MLKSMNAVSRRHFIAALAAAAPALASPAWASSAALAPRALSFTHLHTGERLAVEYFSAGRYLPDALGAIDHVLRDFRTNEIHRIDPALLDLLHGLRQATGSRRPYEVISGFRSPHTNAALRAQSTGVASGSLHMSGKAIDIRVADVPLKTLHDAAIALRRGGVGYYPSSNFVHVDTGRVRTW